MHNTLQDLRPSCVREELRYAIVERAVRGYALARIYRNVAFVTIAVASTLQVIVSCVIPATGATSLQATPICAGGMLISLLTSTILWAARARAEDQVVEYAAYLDRTRPGMRDREPMADDNLG